MTRTAALLAAALVAAFAFPAQASITIRGDLGGRIDQYLAHWAQVARSGELVRLDGVCNSACTLFLGAIPQDRICVTPRAALGFHKAWKVNIEGNRVEAPEGTAIMWRAYPQPVRAWISEHGGLEPEIKTMGARELRRIYRACR
jgi:hypothetical protein